MGEVVPFRRKPIDDEDDMAKVDAMWAWLQTRFAMRVDRLNKECRRILDGDDPEPPKAA